MKKLNVAIMFFLVAQAWAQGTWDQGGPYGGYIQCLTKDTSGNVFAGTLLGGIFKTQDINTGWQQVYPDTEVVDVRSIAINNSGHIFAGLDPGFKRSTDGGSTWQRIVNSLNTRTVSAMLVLGNGEILAGTRQAGLHKSTNNGQSFSLSSTGMSATDIRALAENRTTTPSTVFAATGDGVFRSTSNGANWSIVRPSSVQVRSVGYSEMTGDVIISEENSLYRSTDNGNNWTNMNPPPAVYNGVVNAGATYYAAFSGATTVGGGVISSTDNGTTWSSEPGLPNIPFNAITNVGNTVIAGALGSGTHQKTVGSPSPWTQSVYWMTNTHITSLFESAPDNNSFAVTKYDGAFRSTDRGNTWTPTSSGLPYGLTQSITRTQNGNLFLGHQNGVYRSTNLGEMWTNVNPGAFLATLGFDDQGKVYAGSGSAIYTSTNSGINWSFLTLPGITNIADFAFDANDVYVATGNPEGTTGHGVFQSTDRGATFNPINNGLTELNVTSLNVHTNPASQCRIIAGTKKGGTFKWDESGRQWLIDGLANRSIRRVRTTTVRIASDANDVLGQTSECSWYLVTGPPTFKARVTDLVEVLSQSAGSSANISLLVGTNGRGIFRGTNVISSIPEQNAGAQEFKLLQNYPNPFNPKTTIHFSVGTYGHTSLRVYDVLGREVATLVNEEMQPGSHEVKWDASGVSSGVYLYQLTAGSFVETKRMILLR